MYINISKIFTQVCHINDKNSLNTYIEECKNTRLTLYNVFTPFHFILFIFCFWTQNTKKTIMFSSSNDGDGALRNAPHPTE